MNVSDCCSPNDEFANKATVIKGMICYCFDHTRNELEEAVKAGNEQQIVESIRAKVKAGECVCEAKNPKGVCCLGDVAGVIREAKEALK